MYRGIEDAKAKVHSWVEKHRQAVLFDEDSSALMDVASGKSVRLSWQDVDDFEEKIHPETNETYLVLLFENGSQIALVDPGGVAFAPSTQNTGPLQDLPPVVCLKDFFTLKGRIGHDLYRDLGWRARCRLRCRRLGRRAGEMFAGNRAEDDIDRWVV